MNAEESAKLIDVFNFFEGLFCGDLGEWDTELVNLKLHPYSKQF